VRVNVVDVAKDRTTVLQKAVLQKRMDDDDDDDDDQNHESDLTSEHGPPGPDPEPESESESDSDSDSDSSDSDGGEAAGQWEEEYQNYEPSDMEEDDQEEDNQDDQNEDNQDDQDDSDQDDSDEDDHEQSLESQHPAASESIYEDLWNKLLEGSLRPRTSTSGAVDAPKRELHETDDTRASIIRDVSEFLNTPATSASSVVGRGGTTSLYSAPSHSQNRKKWMLDRLD